MSRWQHLFARWQAQPGAGKCGSAWQIWRGAELGFPLLIKLPLPLLWKTTILFQGRTLSCQRWQRCFHLLHVKMSEIHLLLGLHLSQSIPRIRNSLSSLWLLLSSVKQNDPCFLMFSWTNEVFLMIVSVFTHLRISNWLSQNIFSAP